MSQGKTNKADGFKVIVSFDEYLKRYFPNRSKAPTVEDPRSLGAELAGQTIRALSQLKAK